jgi:hypothetical protein
MSQIQLAEAVELAANWRSFNEANQINGEAIGSYLPHAFTIDVTEIQALINITKAKGVRLYFGYSDPSPAPSGPTSFPMRLIMVGTDASGNDIYNSGQIYDTFNPCPGTCDTNNSPLST